MRTTLGLVLLLVLAGCTGSPATESAPAPATTDARVLPALDAIAGPLEAMAFPAAEPVASGFLGEPTLLSTSAGLLYLTFPGCPRDFSCNNGPVFRSGDDGVTWDYLNLENGSLSPDGPDANGDAMLAIDADGVLYASNLGSGIPVWRSLDEGSTWEFLADVVPEGAGADRQWGWAGPSGHAVQAWMSTAPSRSVAVASSSDGGRNWSAPAIFDDGIGWIGPIASSADGQHIFVPYTLPAMPASDPTNLLLLMTVPDVELKFVRSDDGGASWSAATTGHLLQRNPAGTQWPGTLMAPVLAQTGDGTLVYVWSEEVLDPAMRAAGTVATVLAMTSSDLGATWSDPVPLSGTRTAVMPWVVGGAGSRYAVAYYAADDVRADNDYEGTWDVDVTLVDAGSLATSHVATTVHTGGICARGGVCGLTASDRSLLDFLGGAALPDGRLAVAYVSAPGLPGPSTSGLDGSGERSVHVAVQSSGSLLGPAR